MRWAARALALVLLADGIVLGVEQWKRDTQNTVAQNTVALNAVALNADCRALDYEASARVALLVGDGSAAGELRLDEALAQLRRARKYCRSGFTTVAVGDYRALERALPGDIGASISRR